MRGASVAMELRSEAMGCARWRDDFPRRVKTINGSTRADSPSIALGVRIASYERCKFAVRGRLDCGWRWGIVARAWEEADAVGGWRSAGALFLIICAGTKVWRSGRVRVTRIRSRVGRMPIAREKELGMDEAAVRRWGTTEGAMELMEGLEKMAMESMRGCVCGGADPEALQVRGEATEKSWGSCEGLRRGGATCPGVDVVTGG